MSKKVFELSEKENKSVEEWYESHKCHEPTKRAKLRNLTYSFTPTGIGNSIKVTCTCGASCNPTDVSNW